MMAQEEEISSNGSPSPKLKPTTKTNNEGMDAPSDSLMESGEARHETNGFDTHADETPMGTKPSSPSRKSPAAGDGPARRQEVINDEDRNPGNNLFVSCITKATTAEDLETLFADHGKVLKAHLVFDPHTRESRGFGFVEMGTADEAQKAIAALNGITWHGRELKVETSKRSKPRVSTPGQYQGVMHPAREAYRAQFVGGRRRDDYRGGDRDRRDYRDERRYDDRRRDRSPEYRRDDRDRYDDRRRDYDRDRYDRRRDDRGGSRDDYRSDAASRRETGRGYDVGYGR